LHILSVFSSMSVVVIQFVFSHVFGDIGVKSGWRRGRNWNMGRDGVINTPTLSRETVSGLRRSSGDVSAVDLPPPGSTRSVATWVL